MATRPPLVFSFWCIVPFSRTPFLPMQNHTRDVSCMFVSRTNLGPLTALLSISVLLIGRKSRLEPPRMPGTLVLPLPTPAVRYGTQSTVFCLRCHNVTHCSCLVTSILPSLVTYVRVLRLLSGTIASLLMLNVCLVLWTTTPLLTSRPGHVGRAPPTCVVINAVSLTMSSRA